VLLRPVSDSGTKCGIPSHVLHESRKDGVTGRISLDGVNSLTLLAEYPERHAAC